MALRTLKLETLKDLDFGKANKAFEMALQRAVKDCVDRPNDDRARKIVLQMTVTPVKEVIDNVISCEGANGTFQVRCKIPDWETEQVNFGVRENGSLYFSEESPRDVKQATIFDGDGDD